MEYNDVSEEGIAEVNDAVKYNDVEEGIAEVNDTVEYNDVSEEGIAEEINASEEVNDKRDDKADDLNGIVFDITVGEGESDSSILVMFEFAPIKTREENSKSNKNDIIYRTAVSEQISL